MKPLRASFLATTAAITLGGTAYGADLSFKAPVAAPLPVSTWQGGYIGGHVGVARLNGDCTQTGNTAGEAYYGACSTYSGTATTSSSDTGLVAGAQIGYDWQSRYFVYGVAADWSWTGLNHTTGPNTATPSTLNSFRAQVDWLASFRGRMGLAVDDTLLYVTGGAALGQLKSAAIYTNVGFPTYSYVDSLSDTKVGWVGGLGVEHKVSQKFSILGELLYYDLGNSTKSATSVAGETYTTQFSHQIFVARVGANLRF